MISISIIVPIFNEEKTLLDILLKLNHIKNNAKFEIILVNDGSTDKSKKIIEENSKYYDKVLHLKKNTGKGKAIIEGLKISTKDYVFFQDADLEYDPLDILNFIDLINNFNADLIMGSRFIGNKRSVLHFWHMLGNKFISFLFNLLNNTTFTDIYCCYCLFERKLLPVNKLRSLGWGQQAEILTYLSNNASKIFETAVSYNGRKYIDGKKIRYYNIIEVIYWIFITKFKNLSN